MTKPKEKPREDLTAEIEDGNKKIRQLCTLISADLPAFRAGDYFLPFGKKPRGLDRTGANPRQKAAIT